MSVEIIVVMKYLESMWWNICHSICCDEVFGKYVMKYLSLNLLWWSIWKVYDEISVTQFVVMKYLESMWWNICHSICCDEVLLKMCWRCVEDVLKNCWRVCRSIYRLNFVIKSLSHNLSWWDVMKFVS